MADPISFTGRVKKINIEDGLIGTGWIRLENGTEITNFQYQEDQLPFLRKLPHDVNARLEWRRNQEFAHFDRQRE